MKLGQEYRIVRRNREQYVDQIGVVHSGWKILDYDTVYVDEIDITDQSDGYGGYTTFVYATSRTTNRRFRALMDPIAQFNGPVPIWRLRDMVFNIYRGSQGLFVGTYEDPKPFVWRDK